jgi:hypothetical protein
MEENCEGICVACGFVDGCVEPDAERYECAECESKAVYGIPQLLIMGRVEITGGVE